MHLVAVLRIYCNKTLERDDLGPGRRAGVGEEWLDSGYILNLELIELNLGRKWEWGKNKSSC